MIDSPLPHALAEATAAEADDPAATNDAPAATYRSASSGTNALTPAGLPATAAASSRKNATVGPIGRAKDTPGAGAPDEFNVIIEIPMNADPIKYEVDKESGAMFVDRFMSTAMHYPCNYGYVPQTLADDGDPPPAAPMDVVQGEADVGLRRRRRRWGLCSARDHLSVMLVASIEARIPRSPSVVAARPPGVKTR